MKSVGLFFIISFLFLFSISAEAQSEKADSYFDLENYRLALKYYKRAHKKDTTDVYVLYQIAQCYLRMNADKSKALPYLNKTLKLAPKKYSPRIFFELGLTRFHSHQFMEAIRNFDYYKGLITPDKHALPDEYINYCLNAEALVKTPLNVKFENLGKSINSKSDDFNPYVTAEEGRMLFSSKRDMRAVKVYMSHREIYDNKWEPCKSAGSEINASNDQYVCGLSPDGSTLFLYYNNYDVENNNIVISNYDGKQFQGTQVMKGEINSNKREEGACITLNKDTLFFASSRAGGYGGLDIYMSRRLPNGTWGKVVNLGPEINTPQDDNYPIISADGKKLYFSSKGHNSMGGYDIFSSTWDDLKNSWSPAKNIGYPINTTYNNLNISMLENKRYAYVAAIRPEGFGQLDIYKVIFVDAEPDYFVYSGQIKLEDPQNPNNTVAISKHTDAEFKVSVFDTRMGDYFGVYACNRSSGKYVLALPPGNYEIEIISPLDEYEDFILPVTIHEGSFGGKELKKDLILKHKK